MTTTKLIYLAAVIVPGGFFILAGLVLARSIWKRTNRPALVAH